MSATSATSAPRDAAVAIGVVTVATAYLFAPLLIGALTGHPRFFEWDVPEQYWADLVYLCRNLHEGELPLWNPYDRAGYPYYADPQASAYHPLAWGICAVAGPDPALAWQEARVVLGFAIAGVFTLLWLRRLGVSWAAAGLGAVVVEAGPFMRHNWELNLTGAIAWLPMVLWALERAFQERRARDAALLAVAEAMLIWSGSPPAAWLAGSFTALYAVGRLIEIGRSDRAALRPIVLVLALASVLVLALGAVVLVPGLELSRHSVQAGRAYESIADEGLTLARTLALLWPQDGNHLYVGWITLALAPFALARRTPGSLVLPGRWVLALAAIVAVLLAMGDHGPLFRFAFHAVPGVRMFRLPHRYEAWLGPAMGALAAGGLDALRARAGSIAPHRLAIPAGISFVVGIAWLALGPGLGPASLALAIASISGAALASGREARRERAWTVAALVVALLALLDVSQKLPPERHTRPRPHPGREEIARRVVPRAPDTDVAWRYLDEFGISCRSGTRLARRDLRGYQDPLLLRAYEQVMGNLRAHPELAAQFNVRYALTGPHFIHGWDRHYLPPPEVLRALDGASDRGEGVIEFARAIPLAYLVPSAHVERVTTREAALERTIAQAPAPIAVLEDARASPARADAGVIVEALVTSYRPDLVALEVDAPAAGVLVVNEAWYPGWRAEVDGRETEVWRANGLVRAVEVPSGLHRVELRFEPRDGTPLRWLLLAGWLAVLALCVVRSGARPRSGALVRSRARDR